MDLEAGEYFAVTRGFEYNDSFSVALLPMFGAAPKDNKPYYDRSHEGLIYQAEEVCFPMVAAKCIANKSPFNHKNESVGTVISLNLTEIEIMTLTTKYLKPIGVEAVESEAGKDGQ